MSKADAGRKGGKTTVKKYGKEYMKELAQRGARAWHKKYKLHKLGTSDFAILYRATGQPTGKTLRGFDLS
jgi:hypothetical protein